MFDRAFAATMGREGGYVDHPDDPGGETYRGIARRSHPDWEGWSRIDLYKDSSAFPDVLDSDAYIKTAVRELYRRTYWQPVGGDQYTSPTVASEMFDMAVHMGVKRAILFLQRALNALNREGELYDNITEDGDFGPQTSSTLEAYRQAEAPGFLHKLLLIQRGAFYLDITRRRERSETFLRGWLRRVVMR